MADKPDKTKLVSDHREPDSTAHVHVAQHVDGVVIINSKPPQSVASFQTEQNGHDVSKFFDSENAAKKVDGVSFANEGGILETDQRFLDKWAKQAQNDEKYLDQDRDIDMADDD